MVVGAEAGAHMSHALGEHDDISMLPLSVQVTLHGCEPRQAVHITCSYKMLIHFSIVLAGSHRSWSVGRGRHPHIPHLSMEVGPRQAPHVPCSVKGVTVTLLPVIAQGTFYGVWAEAGPHIPYC